MTISWSKALAVSKVMRLRHMKYICFFVGPVFPLCPVLGSSVGVKRLCVLLRVSKGTMSDDTYNKTLALVEEHFGYEDFGTMDLVIDDICRLSRKLPR